MFLYNQMKYIVDTENKEPAYLQLYRMIRDDVVSGVYPYGSRLPSKRVLADELSISTVTVEHAYALLTDEGYVQARERSGYFVIFRTEDGFAATAPRTQKRTEQNPHLSEEKNDFPFSLLAKTMRSVISDYAERILVKSPGSGTAELRTAIRDYLKRSRGITADAEQIIIGSGSEYLYTLIVELLGRDKIYAIESPSYKKIEEVYLAAEARIEKLPLGSDGVESSALSASSAQVLHISPYRSFPSGVSASASKRHEYLRWARRTGALIIEDDFESEFSVSTKPEETLFSLAGGSGVIYMNSFSKTVSSALRVGYMVLPENLAKRFSEKLGFYSCTVPTFEQLVLAELISRGDFERHVNRVRRKKRREMQ